MNLFAYGTLMEPRLVERIIGLLPSTETATLDGYRRLAFRLETYPGLVPAEKKQSVTGRLYLNLSDLAWKYLDGFEGHIYKRVGVLVKTERAINKEAQTYIVRASYRHLLAETDWDFAEFLRRDLPRYLADPK